MAGHVTDEPQWWRFLDRVSSYNPADEGRNVPVHVDCPTFSSDYRATTGLPIIVEGVLDGDTCTITYLGTGLAEGEPTSKSVMAIGHIDPEFSGEAFFSFVEFRVDGI